MSSRKVPPRASSRLDLGARIPPKAARSTFGNASAPPPASAGSTSARIGVTWLSDMMTADKNSFAVMRLLLALAVLISHSVYLVSGQGALEPLYRWTNYTLGQHGVQVFFFLSGILVTQSLFASRDLRDYATARALRIFPALIVCVLATALLLGPWLTSLPTATAYLKDPGVAAYIAKTLSLWSGSASLPGLFVDNTVPRAVNTSVWTLKYEALCYVVLGLAGWAVLKMQRWRETAVALLAIWLAAVLIKPTGLEIHGGAKSSLDVFRYFTIFFGTGVLAFALRHYIPVHGSLLLPLGYMFWSLIGTRFQEPAAAVFLGYLALWLSTFRFGPLRDFTNQNDYSYATYLYHMPVAQALLYFVPQMPVLSLILATTGIVLWLAFLSWEFVERPALNLRHRIWSKTPERAEAAVDQAIAPAARTAATAAQSSNGSTAAAQALSERTGTTPPSSTHPKQPTVAELTAARAAERLAREMTAARSKTGTAAALESDSAIAQPGTARPDIQPGTAQVWRPMPAVKRLKVQSDDAPVARDRPMPMATAMHGDTDVASPSRRSPFDRTAMPLDLMKRATAGLPRLPQMTFKQMRTDAPTPEVTIATHLPPVPASRIAFATKRPAATMVTPPVAVDGPVTEPTRAVVAVAHEPEPTDVRPRLSQPRPTWTRPLQPHAQPN